MDIQDLLKPRYKVIALWPHCGEQIGNIIADKKAELLGEFYDSFPHLFKPLQWWEERKPEDMPEYIKAVLGKLIGVWKIIKWDMAQQRGFIDNNSVVSLDSMTFPATKEEYESYINQSVK